MANNSFGVGSSRLGILLIASLLPCSALALGQNTASFGKADKAAIEQMFDRYAHAFSAKDYAALRDCIQAPLLNTAGWDVRGTLDEIMTVYRNLRDALDNDNYDHGEFVQRRITALGPDRALVDQTYRRYRKDGTLLLEAAGIYVVSKSSGAWKICGYLAQDPKEFGKVY